MGGHAVISDKVHQPRYLRAILRGIGIFRFEGIQVPPADIISVGQRVFPSYHPLFFQVV